MKPRPRRKDINSWRARGPLSKKKQIKELFEEEKENLHEFAQRIALLPPGENTIWVDKIRKAQINNVCLFCDKQLEMYESKAGNRYMANADHSPHRKIYKCCNTWGEYNGTN